ncbi:MAG: SDR family oxidoreductase [Burkholderiales bacterium]|nr:SDR family oxidoreductase [Burkholderiales bacterium]
MDLQLGGRRALVTGGSRGIGKAVARGLLAEGAQVALLARNEQGLREAVAELGASGARVVGVVADTTRDEQVRDAVRQAAAQLGGAIEILVNAAAEPAGYARPPQLEQIRAEQLHAEVDTKVMGYLRCAREVVPGMRELGWGRIVNVSGLAARQTGNTVGSIRNVAVAALTKNLGDELGPHGIQVSVVHPGVTRTERTAALVAHRAQQRGVPEQTIEQEMAAMNSIGHLVEASEVADVVVFLCSPRSRAINGDAIAAGGGTPRSIHY